MSSSAPLTAACRSSCPRVVEHLMLHKPDQKCTLTGAIVDIITRSKQLRSIESRGVQYFARLNATGYNWMDLVDPIVHYIECLSSRCDTSPRYHWALQPGYLAHSFLVWLAGFRKGGSCRAEAVPSKGLFHSISTTAIKRH